MTFFFVPAFPGDLQKGLFQVRADHLQVRHVGAGLEEALRISAGASAGS